MKTRNKILALLLAVTMPFSFTACGSQDKGGQSKQESQTSKDSVSDADADAGDEKSAADILADAQAKMKDVKSMSAKMSMEMDMEVEAGGEKQTLQTVTDMDMVCFYDPLKMKIDTTMDMGEMGSTTAQIYAQMDKKGNYTMYMTDGTQWQSQSVQLEDLQQYDAAKNIEEYLNADYNFEVQGTEQVDGKNAYKLVGKITGDEMKEVMLSSGAMDSLSSLNMDASQLESFMDGIGDIPIIIWVDEESSYAVKYDIDMSAVMDALMSKMMESMAEQAQGGSISVSKMKIQMTCGDYDAVEDFSIPKEAKKA